MITMEREDKYVLGMYPHRQVVFTKAKGCYLYDESGKEYLDFASNIGVNNIGHGNERVAKAIYEQYLTLGSSYSMFYSDVRAKLAEKLISIAPGNLSKVFFSNSGSESVEAAIKFARASTGKPKILAAMRGFHGKTMGALSATWGKHYQEPFAPLVQGFSHFPLNNIEKFKAAIDSDTAAVILEIIQGEGGVRPAEKAFLETVREHCNEMGALLIIDEVQTGFGRTGQMFASQNVVVPDILCLSKSIAGGIPMGATLVNDKIQVPSKSHTSTFGGNPVACAAALASISVLEENNLCENAKQKGAYMQQRLADLKHPKIKEIRGRGLMIGIELKEKAGKYVSQLMDEGIVALLAGPNVIRLLPPLIITKPQIDTFMDKFEKVLDL